MTKEEANSWFDARPKMKEVVDGLDKSGALLKLEVLYHAYAEAFVDVVPIARAAGYKTGSKGE